MTSFNIPTLSVILLLVPPVNWQWYSLFWPNSNVRIRGMLQWFDSFHKKSRNALLAQIHFFLLLLFHLEFFMLLFSCSNARSTPIEQNDTKLLLTEKFPLKKMSQVSGSLLCWSYISDKYTGQLESIGHSFGSRVQRWIHSGLLNPQASPSWSHK